MSANADAVFFANDEPEIELVDGNFHVAYQLGASRFEVVLPPRAYFAAIARAVEVARKYRHGGTVMPFPHLALVADHAASSTGRPSK